MASVQRPRLVHVVNSLVPGGTERLVVDMALSLSREFDIRVLCLDEPGAWAEVLREAGIAVYGLRRQPGIDLAVAARIAGHLRSFEAQVVHAHQSTAWFYSALARLLYPAPRLLFQEHGRFFPEADRPLRRFVNRVLIRRLTHRFVAVSEDIRSRLVRYEGLERSRILLVYNGVTAASLLDANERSRLRADLGISPDDFVVGTVGRFDPIKNLTMLVSAVGDVCGDADGIKGVMVGDGPELPMIRSRIEFAGLAGRFVLTGHREDARRLVQCMDLFVLASLSEGTSIALLEAMAAGVPVVVTDVAGNPEVVEAGKAGWLVPSGSAAALATIIRLARGQPQRRREMGEAGRRRFNEHFEFGRMLDSYRVLYDALLRRCAPGEASARA